MAPYPEGKPRQHGSSTQTSWPMTGSALTRIRQQLKGSILTLYKDFWVRESGHAGVLLEAGKGEVY